MTAAPRPFADLLSEIDFPSADALREEGSEGAVRAQDHDLRTEDGGIWVFGYGSLMWNPGFNHMGRYDAVLHGYERRFCLWSKHYRGTPEAPGLVLGLSPNASATTRGVAYRAAPENVANVRAYLAERELVSAAYHEVALPISLVSHDDRRGVMVPALSYVIDPTHRQCAAGLTVEEQAAIIFRSRGAVGPNADYLFNTLAHLRETGLDEPAMGDLPEIERLVRAYLDADGF